MPVIRFISCGPRTFAGSAIARSLISQSSRIFTRPRVSFVVDLFTSTKHMLYPVLAGSSSVPPTLPPRILQGAA